VAGIINIAAKKAVSGMRYSISKTADYGHLIRCPRVVS
jgi:ketol-acid reductoisomerase